MGQSTFTTNEAVQPPPSTKDEVLRLDFVGGFRPECRQRRNRRYRRRPQRKCQRVRRRDLEKPARPHPEQGLGSPYSSHQILRILQESSPDRNQRLCQGLRWILEGT